MIKGVKANKPFQIWQADWTEVSIPFFNKTIYIFLIIDTYTRIIYSVMITLDKTGKTALKATTEAIEKAKEDTLFNSEELIFHSDQGSAYMDNEHVAYLEDMKIKISTSDPGKPTQNPFIESFNSLMKTYWINHFEYLSFHELENSVLTFVRRYNAEWLHGEMGYITPHTKLEQYRTSLKIG